MSINLLMERKPFCFCKFLSCIEKIVNKVNIRSKVVLLHKLLCPKSKKVYYQYLKFV